MITIPIYSENIEEFPWYDPAPHLLNNLKWHVASRGNSPDGARRNGFGAMPPMDHNNSTGNWWGFNPHG